jgi:hypothetical protein
MDGWIDGVINRLIDWSMDGWMDWLAEWTD